MPELLLGPHSPRNTLLRAQVVMRVGIRPPTPGEALVFQEVMLGELSGALNLGEHEGNATAFQRDAVDLVVRWRKDLGQQWPLEALVATLTDLTCLSEVAFDAVGVEPSTPAEPVAP